MTSPINAEHVESGQSQRRTPNPYDSPRPDTTVLRRRAVVRPACFAVVTALTAILIAIPGVVMLNQKMQVIPTTTFISGVELNGVVMDNTSVITYSLGIALLFLLSGMYFLALSFKNWSENQSAIRSDRTSH